MSLFRNSSQTALFGKSPVRTAMRLTTAVAGIAVALLSARAQDATRAEVRGKAAQANAQPSASPTFDIASVKPTDPSNGEMGMILVYPGGRLEIRGCTLMCLTTVAYDLQLWQISGGPKWANEDRFSISATPPADSDLTKIAPSNPKLPPPDEERLMLRALLVDRFKLVTSATTEQGSGMALILKERSLKLIDAKDRSAFPVVVYGSTDKAASPDFLQGINAPMAKFAERLSSILRVPVVDETGLPGSFDFKIEYAGDASDTNATGPQLSTAIQELRLKLESAKVPVRHIVIERAERPSEN